MAVLFTAIFRAASLVWDRELGFLRELLIAPVSRSSIIVGKCLGGAIIAASQGVLVLALAWLVDVPYDPLLILGVLGLMLLLAFSVTAFGVLVAVWIKQAQTFTSVMQLFLMPMFFLSGAFFPIAGLPTWLEVLNRIDPLTYAVDAMRHLVFNHLDVSAAAHAKLDPGISWWGWHLPAWFEVGMLVLLGLALMGAAIWRFSRTERDQLRARRRSARIGAVSSVMAPKRSRSSASWAANSDARSGSAATTRSRKLSKEPIRRGTSYSTVRRRAKPPAALMAAWASSRTSRSSSMIPTSSKYWPAATGSAM